MHTPCTCIINSVFESAWCMHKHAFTLHTHTQCVCAWCTHVSTHIYTMHTHNVYAYVHMHTHAYIMHTCCVCTLCVYVYVCMHHAHSYTLCMCVHVYVRMHTPSTHTQCVCVCVHGICMCIYAHTVHTHTHCNCVCACRTWQFVYITTELCGLSTLLCIAMVMHVTAHDVSVTRWWNSKIMPHLSHKSSSFAKTSVPIHSKRSARGTELAAFESQRNLLTFPCERLWCDLSVRSYKVHNLGWSEEKLDCGCNFAIDQFTNSAHMEEVECIIVHGIMHSVSNLASPSLATPTICAILLMFLTVRFS